MVKRQKRRTARLRSTRSALSKPAKKVERKRELEAERLCWLCSRPLSSGAVKSMLGFGVFEVHQRCYEQALKA